LREFVSLLHECGGICIAAHIDSDRGVRKTFRQLGKDGIVFCAADETLSLVEQRAVSEKFKEWLLKAGFDAIEVADYAHKQHYRWVCEDNTISIPALLTNDAHRVEDLTAADRQTHVKMIKPSFQDLRLALKFPDTRIRFPTDVPSTPSPRILGLQILAGGDQGFFRSVEIAFSDNLSCLIGPRGSGKSAIIESLRYAFGLNRILTQLDQSGTDLADKVRSLQVATLTNCIIRVAYCRQDGQTHILESTFDRKQDYVTKVFTPDGSQVDIHDLDTSGAYPLRLFGWSEIETLGRESRRQRDLLDRLIPDFSPLLDKRAELRQTMRTQKRAIQTSVDSLLAIFELNGGEIRKYKEYLADFNRLNTPEIDALFSDIDLAKRKITMLNKVNGNIDAWVSGLKCQADSSILEGIDQLLAESPEPVQTWWTAIALTLKLADSSNQAKSTINKAIDELVKLQSQVTSAIDDTNKGLQENEKQIREKIGQEATKQVAADLRKAASERLERVNQSRRHYNDEWRRLSENIRAWKQTSIDLVSAQGKISEARQKQKQEIEARLNLYSTPEMTISVWFNGGRDRNKLVTHLSDSGLLAKKGLGNYKANLLPLKISLLCNPVELAHVLLEKTTATLTQVITVGNEQISIDAITVERLLSSFDLFGHDEEADVDSIDRDRLNSVLEIAEIEWDDDERILLNSRPVDTLSPGQRSSAMLPLIALAENIPLIIDQPEDNLDNKLVGKMLVDILGNLKEKRQIIVATHNPNIVVSGDAEQVIVLDAINDHEGKCAEAGSIDKPPIVQFVIDIMEGGREAFRTRQRRYNLP